jgi:hypothetical protein
VSKKLKQIPIIEEPTSKEKEERSKELRKCKTNEKKFLEFDASKCHPSSHSVYR